MLTYMTMISAQMRIWVMIRHLFLNSSQNIKNKRILNSVPDNNSEKTNVTEENSDNVELSDTEGEIEVLKYHKSVSVKSWWGMVALKKKIMTKKMKNMNMEKRHSWYCIKIQKILPWRDTSLFFPGEKYGPGSGIHEYVKSYITLKKKNRKSPRGHSPEKS